jgi:hypothetical protein
VVGYIVTAHVEPCASDDFLASWPLYGLVGVDSGTGSDLAYPIEPNCTRLWHRRTHGGCGVVRVNDIIHL